MAEPLRSIFEFSQSGEQKILDSFAKIAKGVKSVRSELVTSEKIGTVVDSILGKGPLRQKNQQQLDQFENKVTDLTDKLKLQQKEAEKLKKSYEAFKGTEFEQSIVSQLEAAEKQTHDTIAALEKLHQEADKPFDVDFPLGKPGGGNRFRIPGNAQGGAQMAQSIGGLLGGAGIGGGQFAELTSTIGDAFDGAGRLSNELREMSEIALEAGGKFSGPLSGGLMNAAKLAGPVAAGIAGVAVAFTVMDAISGKTAESINKAIDARRKQMDTELEYEDLLRSGSTDAIQAEIEALTESIETRKKYRDDQIANAINETSHWDIWRSAIEAELNDAIGRTYEMATTYGAAADAVREYNTQIEEEETRLQNLIKAQDKVAQREAQERVNEARKHEIDLLNQMGDVLDDFGESVAEFNEENAFQRGRELQARQREDERAERDHQRELQKIILDGNEERLDIEKDRLDQIDDAWEEFEKGRVRAVKQLDRAQQEVNEDEKKSLADADANYMRDRVKALETHLQQMAKAERAYDKERKRRLEDLHLELLDAEAANDVARFISAERQAKVDLKRMQEDHKESQSEAERQFEQERAEREEQYRQEREDIKQAAIERRAELQAQYDEEIAQLKEQREERLAQIEESNKEALAKQWESEQKRRAAEIEAFEQRLEDQAEQRRIEDELREEDNQRQLDKMRAAAEKQLKELEKEQDQNYEVIKSGGAKRLEEVKYGEARMRAAVIGSYNSALQQLNSLASSYGASSYGSSNDLKASGYGPSFGGEALFAAKGAYVDKKTFIVAGENTPELILPLDRSQGIPADILDRIGGSRAPVFHFGNIDLGGISPEQFDQGIQELADAVLESLNGMMN